MMLDKKKWIHEGFILQLAQDKYVLGQGPFQKSSQIKKGLYCPDFFLKNKQPCLQAEQEMILSQKDLESFLNEEGSSSIKTQLIEQASFVKFQIEYQNIINKIKSKQLEKMLGFTLEKWQADINISHFVMKALQHSKKSNSYLYGFWNKDHGVLGATPEILFSARGLDFYTMALAGTTSYLGPCLLHDSKEVKEHAYVIQDIEESLKNLITWTHQKTYEKRNGQLKHICTEKKGQFKKTISFSEIISRLHPTAALGTYPKKDFKKHLKDQDRSYFGSPIAYFDGQDQIFCLVAIRNIEWKDNIVRVAAGAGIVKDSDLQKEWQELQSKRNQIKKIFFE